jgi:hypothetical protein
MEKDGDGEVTEYEANNYLEMMALGGFDKNSCFA